MQKLLHSSEIIIRFLSKALLPTAYGTFTIYVYESLHDHQEHIALVYGSVSETTPTLVRLHSECVTGEVFGSLRCDCGAQLQQAMQEIAQAGSGVLIYLRGHEGRGIGLGNKISAYHLQDKGLDTVEANEHLALPIDARSYYVGAQILVDLGVKEVRLMTNNPVKWQQLKAYGLVLIERVPLLTTVTEENRQYLSIKKKKMGHYLSS